MDKNKENKKLENENAVCEEQAAKASTEAEENNTQKDPLYSHPEKERKPIRVSILTLLVCVAFTAIISFMITAIFVSNYKDKRFSESVESVNEKLELINSSVLGVQITDEERLKLYKYLLELDTIFETYEFNEYDYKTITDYILSAYAAASGDKYAEYYNAENLKLLLDSMQGESQGVGINITYDSDNDAIAVINVMPNSPAAASGMLPGDIIVAVGIGEDAERVSDIGYTAAITKLQGVKGTKAEFTVKRGNEEIEFSILRDEYQNQSVVSHLYELDNSVGVIRIMNFDALTPTQFASAMEDFYSKGIRKIVFDVRNNPGGNLDSIVRILDMILPEGPIIRIVNKEGKVVEQIDSEKAALYTDVKFAVLANENTASAAELFTSALIDYKRATFVGTKTFGKGSMQSTLNLSDDRGIKLTTYHYLPPYMDSYEGIGITPDISVELDPSLANKNIFLIEDKDDNQLKAAVESIK